MITSTWRVCKRTFAEAGDDGELGRVHAGAHEEDEVLVARLAEGGDVEAEGLQRAARLALVVQVLRVQDLDGHVAVPVALVH